MGLRGKPKLAEPRWIGKLWLHLGLPSPSATGLVPLLRSLCLFFPADGYRHSAPNGAAELSPE